MKTSGLFIAMFFNMLLLFAKEREIIVSQQGDGDFKTVQEALNAIPLNNKKAIRVFIKNGFYKEKLLLVATKDFVTLVGEDRFNTILSYDDHPGNRSPGRGSISTHNSYSFQINADHFTAKNITFRNDAGFTAGQAVALDVRGDKAVFLECRIIGNQDILFVNSDRSRQYYENCYIEGTTDFIFGSATVWFEQCQIHSKKNSHITAASTPEANRFGFIFYDCKLTGDSILRKVSLGRPWKPYSNVAYLYCYIDNHIMPQGWANWNTTESNKTARYFEYQNYGPGAGTDSRVNWAKQLSDVEIKNFTVANVFGTWNPRLIILDLKKRNN
ncbi:pectinesterase family protein [Pedobacter sp. P351]|uniref:pectinesterase family protein n=1 Tax=Pedobacter superstes TaxID=3133441 RepID=UPI0030A1AD80